MEADALENFVINEIYICQQSLFVVNSKNNIFNECRIQMVFRVASHRKANLTYR